MLGRVAIVSLQWVRLERVVVSERASVFVSSVKRLAISMGGTT
jgi:hypothetical protein